LKETKCRGGNPRGKSKTEGEPNKEGDKKKAHRTTPNAHRWQTKRGKVWDNAPKRGRRGEKGGKL